MLTAEQRACKKGRTDDHMPACSGTTTADTRYEYGCQTPSTEMRALLYTSFFTITCHLYHMV